MMIQVSPDPSIRGQNDRPRSAPPTDASGSIRAAALAALTAEYTALRDEIGRHQDHRNQLFSIALAIMAAVVGFAGTAVHGGKELGEGNIVFLLAPLLFVFLGSAYVDRGRRMLAVATYINRWLRQQMFELTGANVWMWERFKKAHYKKSKGLAPSVAMTLDVLRGMIFVFCGVISLVLYGALPGTSLNAGRTALLALDSTLLLLLTALIWLFEETRGVPGAVFGTTAPAAHARPHRNLRWKMHRPLKSLRRSVHGPYPKTSELPENARLATTAGVQDAPGETAWREAMY